jgi:hypothetical protein
MTMIKKQMKRLVRFLAQLLHCLKEPVPIAQANKGKRNAKSKGNKRKKGNNKKNTSPAVTTSKKKQPSITTPITTPTNVRRSNMNK